MRCITATLLLALACPRAFAAESNSNAAAARIALEDMQKKLTENCNKEIPAGVRIYADRTRHKLLDAFDPEKQCEVNSGGEVESHNARVITAEIWDKRPDWVNGKRLEGPVRQVGACRKNYQAIEEAYSYYHLLQERYCKALNPALSAAISCDSKRCETDYRQLKEIFTRFQKHGKDFGEQMKTYLSATAKASEEAVKKYEADLKVLDQEARRKHVPGAVVGSLELIDHPTIKPSNGNKHTPTLKDYYEALSGQENGVLPARTPNSVQGVGRLITEHKDADRRVTKFKNDLDSLLADQVRVAESSAERFETLLKGVENAATPKDSPMAKLSSIAGPATSATQMAGQVFGNQHGPAASTLLGTGAGAAPLAAAAVAAAAAASSGFGGSASQAAPAESLTPQEAARPLAPKTDVAKLDGNDPLPTANIGGGGVELPKTAPKGEGGKVEMAQAAFPAFGAGEGTSRMISGTKRGGKGPAPAEGKAPDAGIGEEGFANFGSRGMDPKPAPKGTQLSAGAEVANLLGQMKDLFNFDAGPGPAGSPAGSAMGLPSEPGLDQGATSGFAEGAEEGAPGTDGEVAASNGEAAPARSAEVQASQFGKVDTSLFKRVRQRHTRCMERGLVLYQLGERVE